MKVLINQLTSFLYTHDVREIEKFVSSEVARELLNKIGNDYIFGITIVKNEKFLQIVISLDNNFIAYEKYLNRVTPQGRLKYTHAGGGVWILFKNYVLLFFSQTGQRSIPRICYYLETPSKRIFCIEKHINLYILKTYLVKLVS